MLPPGFPPGLVPGFPPLIPPPPGVDPAVWAAAAAQHAASTQPPGSEPKSKEQSMKDAAAALQSAAQLSKRRRCMVAVDEVPGFVRTVRSRRPAVLRCLHAVDATRVHLLMKWVVSFSISRPFGPI